MPGSTGSSPSKKGLDSAGARLCQGMPAASICALIRAPSAGSSRTTWETTRWLPGTSTGQVGAR